MTHSNGPFFPALSSLAFTPRVLNPRALTFTAPTSPVFCLATLLCLLMLCAGLPARADGTATLESHRGNRMLEVIVHWADDRLRLDIPSRPASYLLRRGATAYLVSDLDNRLVVINLTNLHRPPETPRGEAAPDSPRQAIELNVLEPLHKQEAVGGIQGEVYRLSWVDGGGQPYEERLVVSDHPLVVELLEGMQAYYHALNNHPDPIISALVTRELGMLRFAGRFRLLSISGEPPDPSLFALPGGAKVLEASERHGDVGKAQGTPGGSGEGRRWESDRHHEGGGEG
ncbi:hypothetical protein [Onishia taeanensis]